MSLRSSLMVVGVSRSTWHYYVNGRDRVENPILQSERVYPRALSLKEKARISELIKQSWASGNSVNAAFAKTWDTGEYLASPRSWYRVAAGLNQRLRPVSPSRTRKRKSAVPVLEAAAPDQVWVWDITDLRGPYRGVAFKAYCVQDLLSRKIVAHCVHQREQDVKAVEMFEKAFANCGVPEYLHSDNGSVMRSNVLQELCHEMGIIMTFNRPNTSNDNAFKESEFRTMKHRPNYPGYFESLAEARVWVQEYVDWFNNEHHHSSLAWHTPATVYDGSWVKSSGIRKDALAKHYQQHPDRYHRKPKVNQPPNRVGINLNKQ